MLAYGLIFGGCCSNVYTLELLVQHVSKSGNLITFGQFVIVAVIGLYANLSGFRLKKRSIPIFYWIIMVLLFSAVSVLNNYALGFNISMPLHIIFRSASLLFSMIIGYLFFNQRFSVAKIFGVILVTLGIVITTFETANQTSSSSSASMSEWILGISILTAALILSCFLGQYQQWLYQRYPKEWKEGLFYTHILSLPLFGFLYQDLSNQISIYNASARLSVFDIVQNAGLDDLVSSSSPLYFIKFVPVLWAYLALNVITHCTSCLIRLLHYGCSYA
jgi:UDP-xylose/UDP-N-acetylglucosamine transporter B4